MKKRFTKKQLRRLGLLSALLLCLAASAAVLYLMNYSGRGLLWQEPKTEIPAEKEKKETAGEKEERQDAAEKPGADAAGRGAGKDSSPKKAEGVQEEAKEAEEAGPEETQADEEKDGADRAAERRDTLEEEAEPPYEPPVLLLASDIHYMSPKTHDDGRAFQEMEAADDGKTNAYSEELLDVLLAGAARTRPSVLVLAGDLTHDGERISHEELAGKLAALAEAGTAVAVIPGNHDINNEDASVYFGDAREEAEYLETAEDFLEIYHAFGYDQAMDRDAASLSYLYAVDETHWLLMLDSAQYEIKNEVNGRIREETLSWMASCLDRARQAGAFVIPVAHHNLLSESRLYTFDCTMENHEEVLKVLETYGLPLFVSGHLHAQRIKTRMTEPADTEPADTITEIVLAAYSLAPNQYGRIDWGGDGSISFVTCRADVEAYALAWGLTDENLLNFSDYAERSMCGVITAQAMEDIYGVPDSLKEEMAGLYADLYFDYCAGSAIDWAAVKRTRAYRLWQRAAAEHAAAKKLKHMADDARDPSLSWSLAAP